MNPVMLRPRPWTRGVVLLVLLSCAPLAALAATNWARLAVMPFHNLNGDKAQESWSEGLRERLHGAVRTAQPFKYDVCELDEVERALTNTGWKAGAEVTRELAAKLAADLRSSTILSGEFSRVEGLWRVKVQILRIRGIPAEQSFALEERSTQGLLQQLAEKACAALGLTPHPAMMEVMRKYPVSDPTWDKLAALSAEKDKTTEEYMNALRKILASETNCYSARSRLVESLVTSVFQEMSEDKDKPERGRKLEEATAEAHKMLEQAPGSCAPHVYLAMCYSLKSSSSELEPEAKRELLAALKAHPGCPSACQFLFPALASQERWEELRALASEAHREIPPEPRTATYLAVALGRLGDSAGARSVLSGLDISRLEDANIHAALLDAASRSGTGVMGRELLWLQSRSATNSAAERYWSEVRASFYVTPPEDSKPLKPPRNYSAQELRAELERRLTPDERRLAASPIQVTEEIEAAARELTSGITNLALKATLLSAYVSAQRENADALDAASPTNAGPQLACHFYASQLVALARAAGIPGWLAHVELSTDEASGYHDRAALMLGDRLFQSDPMWGRLWVSASEDEPVRVLDDLEAIAHHLSQTNSPPALRVALKLDPDGLWTRIVCVIKLAEADQVGEAEALFKNLPPASTNRWDYYLARGVIDGQKKNYPAALTSLLIADHMSPNNMKLKYTLGLIYGSLNNQAKAEECLQKAMELGAARHLTTDSKEVRTQIGMLGAAKIAGDMPLDRLRELAGRGDLGARTALVNRLFQQGPKGQEEALKLLRELAETGDSVFQENYARNALLLRGEKAGQEAIDFLRRAAKQGNTQAQSRLALELYRGRVVAKDEVEASLWGHVALEKGGKDAQRLLEEMKLFLDPTAFEDGRRRALDFKPTDSDTGGDPRTDKRSGTEAGLRPSGTL